MYILQCILKMSFENMEIFENTCTETTLPPYFDVKIGRGSFTCVSYFWVTGRPSLLGLLLGLGIEVLIVGLFVCISTILPLCSIVATVYVY